MIVELLDSAGQPHVLEVSQLVVRGEGGTPLAMAVRWGQGSYYIAKVGDPDFEQALTNLGLGNVTLEMLPIRDVRDLLSSE